MTKFIQFFSKIAHISGSKNVHICTFAIVTVQICTGTVAMIINFFFISPLSDYFIPMFTTTQQNIRRRRKKPRITTNLVAPPPPPNQHQHKSFEHLIIHHKVDPKSTDQKTQLKIKPNPLENPTQNQSKLIEKSNSKTIQTHWETQFKINSNSLENHPKPKSKPNHRCSI